MAITIRGLQPTPVDNGSLFDPGPGNIAINVLAGMVTGDLVELEITRHTLDDIVLATTGGQAWTPSTLRQGGSESFKKFWCQFNGTWTGGGPSLATVNNAVATVECTMSVVIPNSASDTWAVDVAEAGTPYTSPSTPFDVTRAGQTTIAPLTITIASFVSLNNNGWGLRTGGWANIGNAQYRNHDTVGGRSLSHSIAYLLKTPAGATGSVTNRQSATAAAGITSITTYKELSSGTVTISAVDDALFHNGETGVSVVGTSFGASKTGPATVIVSPTDNIADGGAVVQPTSAWADTGITLGALSLSTFGYFTNLFLFVKNASGVANASGFVIQREALMNITGQLKNFAGVNQVSLSNIRYSVRPTTQNGVAVLSGTNLTSDGSGNVVLPTFTTVSGGSIAPGDNVWVELSIDGATNPLSPAFAARVAPVYS